MANVHNFYQTRTRFNLNFDGTIQEPNIYLCDKRLKKICMLYPVDELNIIKNLNAADECSFKIYKYNNGNVMNEWDRIKELSIILIEGFGLFELSVNSNETDTVVKNVIGKSLQESELSQCNCTLEINTEDDIARTDYDENYPTLFYRQNDHSEASLLHRILTYVPTYTIGHVDISLWNLNREFSCSDMSVYNFLQTVAEEIGCIFIFDPYSRTINAFDLQKHCLNCNCRHIFEGKCYNCGSTNIEEGYGLDISVYFDTHTIANEITLTGDKDSLKNCLKLVAGDDVMTNMLGQRIIGNTQYMWSFSDYQMSEMSDRLMKKYKEYVSLASSYQDEFDELWLRYDKLINNIEYYKHSKCPSVESGSMPKPVDVYNQVTSTIKYTCIGNKSTNLSTLSRNILNYVKLIIPKGYTAKWQKDTDKKDKVSCTTAHIDGLDVIQTWTGYLHIYVEDSIDDEGNYKYEYLSPAWRLDVKQGYNSNPVSTEVYGEDYFYYLKQQIDVALARMEAVDSPKYDNDYSDSVNNHLSDKDYYKNYFREYSITQLESWKEAYEKASVILFEQNNALTDTNKNYHYVVNGITSANTIYDILIKKYKVFVDYCTSLINEYQLYVEADEIQKELIYDRVSEINQICNMRNYLGDELYKELLTFKREQVYTNDNIISDGLDDVGLLARIKEFIMFAKEDLAKNCQMQYSLTASLGNILSDIDYRENYNEFMVGNYVFTRVDEKLVKLRIVSIEFNFENIENINITFSDALVGNTSLDDIHSILSQAQSMTTSFDYVRHQTESNNGKLNDFDKMFAEGLDATNTLIKNADNLSMVIDSHGLLSRQYDYDLNDYTPFQLRITNATIAMTTDGWQTISAAFGLISWKKELCYGLIADKLIGQEIIGHRLEIINESQTYIMDNDGFHIIAENNNRIDLNANKCSFDILQNGKNKFHFSPADGLIIDGKGIFHGTLICQKDAAYVEIDPSNPSMVIFNGSDTLLDFNSDGKKILKIGEKTQISGNSIVTGTIDASIVKVVKLNASNITTGTMSANYINGGTIDAKKVNIVNLTAASITTDFFKGAKVDGAVITSQWNDNQKTGTKIEGGSIWSNSAYITGGKISLTGRGSSSEDCTIKLFGGEYYCYLNPDGLTFGKEGEHGNEIYSYYGSNYASIPKADISLINCTEFVCEKVDNPSKVVPFIRCGVSVEDRASLTGSDESTICIFGLNKENSELGELTYIRGQNIKLESFEGGGIFADGTQISSSSDENLKHIYDIEEKYEDFFNNLTPVLYRFKDTLETKYHRKHIGFGARAVEKSLTDAGLTTEEFGGVVKTNMMYNPKLLDDEDKSFNEKYYLRYEEFIALNTWMIKKLIKRVNELENKMEV